MRKAFVPIVAVVAAVAFAACGGGSSKGNASGTTPTSTTTPTGGRGFRNSAFTTCLKQHGVTLPSRPPGGPRGGSGGGGFFGGAGLSSADQAAFSACQSKLPAGRFGGRGFAGGATATQITAYLSCLSDHGVRVPTTTSAPQGSGGSGFPRLGTALRGLRADPHFAAASKTCAALLPARGGTAPTTPAAG